MLRAMPSLGLLQREIRMRVCSQCRLRPPHSESLGPEAVRPCELHCPIVTRLPGLRKTAILTDPMLRSRKVALERRIDEICGPGGEASPLGRYRAAIVHTLLKLYGET